MTGPIVSDAVIDDYAEEAKEIVKTADYSKCDIDPQGKVQRFFVVALCALIQNTRKNGDSNNGPRSPKTYMLDIVNEWFKRAPYAVALIVFVFGWLYAKHKGYL